MRLPTRSMIVLLMSLASAPTLAEPPARTPWTTSRFAGSPEPPLPYVVERVFQKQTFDRPVLLDHVPGSNRLVVGELAGKVVAFDHDQDADRAETVIDLAKARPGTTALYGLAFHPQFVNNGYVYICYVLQNERPDGSRVSRFTMSREGPPRIDPDSEVILLTFLSGGHNGGGLAFGKDGFLYISTGDATAPSPPDGLDTGQDVGDLLSSILRIDVDRTEPGRSYRVPPDNPFVGKPGVRPEIWAFGFRNPWRMSFDRETGDLWVGDVGWELWELVYRVERGGNYGWSVMEGRQPIRIDSKRGPGPILPPTADHPHSEAASITGGYVYRGRRLKDLVGTYVYGDYQSGKVWGLRHDGKRVTWRGELAETGLRLVSFGEGRDGEIYLVEHERSNGLYRLIPNPAPTAEARFPRMLGESGLFASTKGHRPAPGVVPYAIRAAMWSDGARAERLVGVPGEARIAADKEARWKPPEGAVLARTVTLDLVEGEPSSRRKVETQVLHFEDGSWRPYTYIWNDEQTDAALADADGAMKTFSIRDEAAPGGRREHEYRFAARSECLLCHNPWVEAKTTVFGRQSASPLAFGAEQVDGDALARAGLFDGPPSPVDRPTLVDPYDRSADRDARVRSYLHVNCSQCHQFNAGGAANIALGFGVDLKQTKMVGEVPIQGTFGIDDARVIAPGEPERSVLFYRVSKLGAGRMPRIGSQRVDPEGARLIADWIAAMPRAGSASDRLDALIARAIDSPTAEVIGPLTATTRGALALARRLGRDDVPAATRSKVAAVTKSHPKPEVRDLFERFLPDAERVRRLGDAIDVAALLALPGDAERGRRWYFAESAAQCRSCHKVEGVGSDLGPDLNQIGAKYPKADLLRHILEPSREIDPKYATRLIATRDGRVIEGLLAESSATEVVVRDAKGQAVRVPLADVEEQTTPPRSLMPEGLLRDLTAQQAADLLEFLAGRK